MSEDVRYKGKLTVVSKPNEPVEYTCKRLCEENGIGNIDSSYDTWEEQLLSECYEMYHVYSDKVYHISKVPVENDYEHFEAHRYGDSILFDVKYYNGGCELNEALDYAMENLEKDADK